MAEARVKRKLSAILSGDVVGYSRMMSEDEAATLNALNTCDAEIIEPTVKEHNGRIFKRLGDGFLVEFSSAVDSVECAIAWQKQIEEKNFPLQFRIGINLGDVIAKDDDVYGDGVNIAARVEKLSDPGGICITQDIFNQIKKKLDIGFEYLGEQQVKNISEPIRVYKLLVKPEDAGKVIGEKKTLFVKRPWLIFAGLAFIVLTVGAVTLWNTFRQPEIEAALIEKMAYALPEKPSIAVMPFENLSEDVDQEYFADGITQDIITDLSKISGLFVVASGSTFGYKGKDLKVHEIAEAFGVRHILKGSVRRSGDRMRINIQLIDALKGAFLWAERYDRPNEDIFYVQDDVTQRVVSELAVTLKTSEQEQLFRKHTESLEAYETFLRARRVLDATMADTMEAKKLFERVIELDPDFAGCTDAMILVDLARLKASKRRRYIGI